MGGRLTRAPWKRAGRRDSRGAVTVSAPGYLYVPNYVSEADRAELTGWLGTLTPLWEQRFSTKRPLPPREPQRPLLRPVYWLGNWQFACLGYYHPTKRKHDSAVAAEPFPPVLARLVAQIEARARKVLAPGDIPKGWHLNTCLINFYGKKPGADDAARVGSHADDEPGPVASLSFGERALIQFVRRGRNADAPVRSEWLADRGLQLFAGPMYKDTLLHRIQRVEDKAKTDLEPKIPGWRTRRINLTLRYVPDADVVPYTKLAPQAREDVREYVETLAASSSFWAAARDG